MIIGGVWLRREADCAVVLVECDGDWVEIVREPLDSQFSHIVEPSGIQKRARKPIPPVETLDEYGYRQLVNPRTGKRI